MAQPIVSTASLDYLQRAGMEPASLGSRMTYTTAAMRRLVRVRGIGRLDKEFKPTTEKAFRLLSEGTVVGLYGYRIPLVFLVTSGPGGVAVDFGTWSRHRGSETTADSRQAILESVLRGLYPQIDLEPAPADMPGRWPLAGLVLGVPTKRVPDPLDGALPLDQLLRALSGGNWACLVLAEPQQEGLTNDVRHRVINEMRAVEAVSRAEGAPSPLAKHYTELLEATLWSLTQGQAVGTWRTAVYLLGDEPSYHRLVSTWRSIYSGDASMSDPVRVWDRPEVADLAAHWALPDVTGRLGPGHYQHPFEYQTLLTSLQLAPYVQLPELETSGYTVKMVPDFDVVPDAKNLTGASVSLGRVLQAGRPTETRCRVAVDSLSKHVFVPGVTGAGKSNTVMHLLKEAARAGVPFLVIEPAKAEYRALLNDPELGESLEVYTLGDERFSPFRLNPFEVLPGASVGVHLDLLRSAFSAGFAMWTPLPQVLEQSLHEVYLDRGWDIATNHNRRGVGNPAAFPTLADLIAKVEAVALQLGYEERITADIHAALRSRINGLRAGGKGRMFDVQRSLPIDELLDHRVVLELEGMGDDDDKAFVMGLLLIRLVEYRRASGERKSLQHLLVIEEAHRLLTNVQHSAPSSNEQPADPRGKAVESFTNLLSEIRAYGQGVIIADQVPTRLAPDAIKNTNLKLAHKIVAGDDRTVLGQAMSMNERQVRALANLERGQVAVFADGEDAPVLVKIDPAKDELVADKPMPTGQDVRGHMERLESVKHHRPLFQPTRACQESCPTPAWEPCLLARQIVEDSGFQTILARAVLSAIEHPAALDRAWPQVLATVRAKRPPKQDEASLLHCVAVRAAAWFANRRGDQAGWTYTDTGEFDRTLRAVLLSLIQGTKSQTARNDFQQCAIKLHYRPFPPYPACERVCTQPGPVCLYRHAASEAVAAGTFRASWHASLQTPFETRGAQAWDIAQQAGYELIDFPENDVPEPDRQSVSEAAKRTCLCFAQQMLASEPAIHPRLANSTLEQILTQAEVP